MTDRKLLLDILNITHQCEDAGDGLLDIRERIEAWNRNSQQDPAIEQGRVLGHAWVVRTRGEPVIYHRSYNDDHVLVWDMDETDGGVYGTYDPPGVYVVAQHLNENSASGKGRTDWQAVRVALMTCEHSKWTAVRATVKLCQKQKEKP